MEPIRVPTAAQLARPDCHVVPMGPPVGVTDDDCGTAEMLIGGRPIPGFAGCGQYAYFRPSAEEIEQLRAGGFLELNQIGNVVQPFSLAVWPAEQDPPNEGVADDNETRSGEAGSHAAAAPSRTGADSLDVGAGSSEATPASQEGGAGEPRARTTPGSHLTTDRTDPRLGHGVDDQPVDQHDTYLVLSAEERAKGFVRPLRTSYLHLTCGAVTAMSMTIAATYARDPGFYGATYCVCCKMHRPVGHDGEFVWDDRTSQKVGT